MLFFVCCVVFVVVYTGVLCMGLFTDGQWYRANIEGQKHLMHTSTDSMQYTFQESSQRLTELGLSCLHFVQRGL